jgi:hypothetical protein
MTANQCLKMEAERNLQKTSENIMKYLTLNMHILPFLANLSVAALSLTRQCWTSLRGTGNNMRLLQKIGM